MYCSRCGAQNDDYALVCIGCGSELQQTGPPQAGVPPRATHRVGVPPSVPNYLVQAILVTLFCCLPFGIVAIVFAAQVNTKLAAGDYAGAVDSSNKARTWCWVSFGLGLAGSLIWFLFAFIGALSGM